MDSAMAQVSVTVQKRPRPDLAGQAAQWASNIYVVDAAGSLRPITSMEVYNGCRLTRNFSLSAAGINQTPIGPAVGTVIDCLKANAVANIFDPAWNLSRYLDLRKVFGTIAAYLYPMYEP